MSAVRNYVIVTASYWGFTLSDGAIRMLVLLHFYSLGYTPFMLAFLFLLYEAVGIFASQIVRKLAYCEAGVIFAVIVGFVTPYGGWPMLIGGVPGLALIAFETWPSLRNTSMTAAMLDSEGAESGLVEAFRSW